MRKASIYDMYFQLAKELREDNPDMDWGKDFDSEFWRVNVFPMINRINRKYGFKLMNKEEII